MNHQKIIELWLNRANSPAVSGIIGNRRYNNVFADGDSLYSYGYHFEMARIMRNKKGVAVALLLNGDTFSVTTSRHQSILRSVVSRSSIPSVIIPHAALASAGIDISTVQIVEALKETHTDHGLSRGPVVPKGNGEWMHWAGRACVEWGGERQWVDPTPLSRKAADLPRKYQWDTYHSHYSTAAERYSAVGAKIVEWEWKSSRHQLGESLIRATYRTRTGKNVTALFLSGFDVQESRPLYFFCQMPRSAKGCKTVAEAYEALKPELVLEAERAGRAVFRQGDIFAAETLANKRELRKRGATFEKRGNLLGTNHEATEVARLGKLTYARGVLWHRPAGRQADHKRVPMGDQKSWFLVAKNTVPVSK